MLHCEYAIVIIMIKVGHIISELLIIGSITVILMKIYLDMMSLVKYQHFFLFWSLPLPVETTPSSLVQSSICTLMSQLGVCILTIVVLCVVHSLFAPIATTAFQVSI